MSWNYRHNNGWQAPTIKRRKNGQWVTISSDDVGGSEPDKGTYPARFYTAGPPERDGNTITYDGTNYSSLQAAHDDLSPGDTLYIDPSNSPYIERLFVTQSHITIESDGAYIQRPNSNNASDLYIGDYNTGGHSFHPEEERLVGSHSGGGAVEDGITDEEGDQVLNVTNASTFSIGDDIFIEEDRRPYGEPASGGASGAGTTHEYKTVTDIDTANDTITVHHPLFLPYPNSSETAVGRMDWVAEDVYISGLNLRGDPNDSSSTPLGVYCVSDVWIENMTIEDAYNRGAAFRWTYNNRLNDIRMNDLRDYGISVAQSSTQTLITDVVGNGIGHYVVRFGPGGGRSANSVDGLVDGITGQNFSNNGPAANVHWGGFYVEYRDLTVIGERSFRPRSRHLILDGFFEDGSERQSIVFQQRPAHIMIKNGTIKNKKGSTVFSMNLHDSTYGNTRGEDLNFENITIDAYDGRDITEIGSFGSDFEEIDGLHFKNIYYDGTKLTQSDVEAWSGYDSDRITNLTVE